MVWTCADDFAANAEIMYRQDPNRLLGFVNRLHSFGRFNKNPIIIVIKKWYVSEVFPTKKNVRLLRTDPQRLHDSFRELIEDYNQMSDRLIGKENHETMLILLARVNPLVELKDRNYT